MSGLIKLVRAYDPAYAGAVPFESMRPYIGSRRFEDLPELPAGMAPVIFHCKRLKSSQLTYADHGTTEEERFSRAFAAGVLKVTGGSYGDGWKPSNAEDPRRVHMPDDEIEEFAALDKEEIGGALYMLSKFPPDCSPHFLLRPISAAAWDGNVRRYAAAKSQARASSAPPEGA